MYYKIISVVHELSYFVSVKLNQWNTRYCDNHSKIGLGWDRYGREVYE